MARRGMIVSTGLDEEIKRLGRLGRSGRAVISAALYAGADVIADSIKAAIMELPIGTPKKNSETGHPFTGLTEQIRSDLADGVGIATFDDSKDGRTTAISIEGYTETGDWYTPLPMIARSLESGSSVRKKHPFIRRAVNGAKEAADAAMVAAGEAKLREIAGE